MIPVVPAVQCLIVHFFLLIANLFHIKMHFVVTCEPQALGSLIVLGNSGAAMITIVRTVNVLTNCSVRLRATAATGSTAVAGTDFAPLDVTAAFAPGQTLQTIAVAVFPPTVYRATDATFTVTLLNPLNCSLSTASLVVAIRGMIPPPVQAPAPAPAPAADQLVFRWAAPAWQSTPPPPWDAPLQFEVICNGTNVARGMSGVYPSVLVNDSDPTVSDVKAATWSVTLRTLSPGTAARCKARMLAAGGWGEFGLFGTESVTASACSNGWRELGEECDDGNYADGDGCGRSCAVEMGWACSTITPGQPDACSFGCGDRTVAGAEECDDGNLVPGDGCSPSCRAEAGWVCPKPAASGMPSSCSTVCGDGVWVRPKEGCDDGNAASGDGCSSSCTVEPGAVCSLASGPGPGGGSVCRICGNMQIEQGEACDDGNISGACADCTSVRPGWSCATAGGRCTGGPLPPTQPQCVGLGVSWVAWEWDAADGLGMPVLYYNCHLLVVPVAAATADWGAAMEINTSVGAGVRPQLVALNLSAATAYSIRVRACSAAGCGAAGPDSFAVTTQAAAYLALQALGAGLAAQSQAAGLAVGLNVSGVSVLVPATPPQPLPPAGAAGLLNESALSTTAQDQPGMPSTTSSQLSIPSSTFPTTLTTSAMPAYTTTAVFNTDGSAFGMLIDYYNVSVQVLSSDCSC